jgi:hypothetical protein
MINESLSVSEITHYTNWWCRSKGISANDLSKHKQIDDVMLLLHISEEFKSNFNLSEQSTWGALWDWTYHRSYPLKAKHKLKLETICTQALVRRQQKQNQIEKIRQLRQAV